MDALSFLAQVYGGDKPRADPSSTTPFVTLTFAQSLDAKIAGANGAQLILSGKESMVMTHWMRTMHDGILVGIGTALNDDPQLNTRHLPPSTDVRHIPRPIVLDTDLRLSVDCKLLRNFRDHKGRRPWILCSKKAHALSRRQELESAGAKVVPVDSDSDGRLNVSSVLTKLRSDGIQTLMVEGGARIIESFLTSASLVNQVILTIAPVIVGQAGVGYVSPGVDNAQVVRTAQIGRDFVVALSRDTSEAP